ncbi:MAG: lipopolysaccharide heptosyltransferase II [Candidatus Riflebacteria bacterium]|nr:lipopolysaccharide heptosyltransferase II [Candidatus Riflebacteria bacterium]
MRQINRPSRVLVRLPNWVGDACLALPFVQALRQALPQAHIAALARPNVAGVAAHLPVDETLLLEDRGPLWVRPWRLKTAGSRLRARKFEIGFTLPTTTSSALLLRMAGIPLTVGIGKGPSRFLLSHPLRGEADGVVHRAATYLSLLGVLVKPLPPLVWAPSPVAPRSREEGLRRLEPLGAVRFRVALGVGSVGTSRRWPTASYAALADRLSAQLCAGVVLVGGPADRSLAEAVVRQSTAVLLNLVGATEVEEMPGLLAATDLLISNDSGAAHLAALALTPTVVFFGAGDPRVTAPLASGCRVLRHPVECAPCLSNSCRFELECMTGITVEQVFAEAGQILGSIRRASS